MKKEAVSATLKCVYCYDREDEEDYFITEETIEYIYEYDELEDIVDDEEEYFEEEPLEELEDEEVVEEEEEEFEEEEEVELEEDEEFEDEEEPEEEFEEDEEFEVEEDLEEEEFDFEEEEFEEDEEPEEEFEEEDEVIEEDEEVDDEPEVLDEDEEEYDAIVLVPAEDNPPVYEEDEELLLPDLSLLNNEIGSSDYEDEEEIIRNCENLRCQAVTIMDKEYPEHLKQVYKPPLVLFYYGDLSLIHSLNNCIGVIGSRKNTG